ncbi:hypothetical protein [Neomesorhizobium albiziae]|nr:hypothetical protein [Mesorhizobium albiziae]
MADNRQNIMEKAETRFMETQKKNAEKAKAMNEYQTEAKLRAQKTAKLRELRLARDEAERAAEALKPVEPKKKRASRAAK